MSKYSSLMNKHNIMKSLDNLNENQLSELLSSPLYWTEKIHGENFRIGYDNEGKFFIGQKNQTFYNQNHVDHPHWNKFSDRLKEHIDVIRKFLQTRSQSWPMMFTGELAGPGMQSGFSWPWDDGLRVYFFEIKIGDVYVFPKMARKIFSDLNIDMVPSIGIMTLREALKFDIESLHSKLADTDHIEGIVGVPTKTVDAWPYSNTRFAVKLKTDKYTEKKQRVKKSKTEYQLYDSPFNVYVTEARINHAIQKLKERGVDIKYEPSDLQYIPAEVVSDIEREENEGNPLDKKDMKSVRKEVSIEYKRLLQKRIDKLFS